VVGASFGEGDDVVDFVGEGLAAHVACVAVCSEDLGSASGFGAAAEGESVCLASGFALCPRFGVGVGGAGAEVGASGDAAWIGG